MRPTTLRESMVRSVLAIVIDAVTPSGTGLKSRCAARAFSVPKSCPAIRSTSRARSSEIQPSTAARFMFLSGVTRSNCSPVFDWTTLKG